MTKQRANETQEAAKNKGDISPDPILREFISDDLVNSYDLLQHITRYFEALTPQERATMILVLYGHNQTEIAQAIGYSQQQVSRFIKSARQKAGVILASYKGQKYTRKKRVLIP